MNSQHELVLMWIHAGCKAPVGAIPLQLLALCENGGWNWKSAWNIFLRKSHVELSGQDGKGTKRRQWEECSRSGCCSIAKSCLTLRNPTDCSNPGFPVPHHLLLFSQVHVYWIGDAVQPSHPLMPSSPSWSLQSFPASGSFPMTQLLASGGQSIGASASVLPKSIQGRFPLRSTGWSLCSPRDSQEFSPAPQLESVNSSALYLLHGPAFTSIHDNWKDQSLDYMDLCWQSDVFAFNTLSRFVRAFQPRSNCLLISWLQHHPQWF